MHRVYHQHSESSLSRLYRFVKNLIFYSGLDGAFDDKIHRLFNEILEKGLQVHIIIKGLSILLESDHEVYVAARGSFTTDVGPE